MGTKKIHIPFHQASIDQKEERAIVDVLHSGWLTKGPRTVAFEKQLKTYIGAKYAVAVNSCTAGLHLALVGLGIGETDEVITTPLTFAATANVIVHSGARVRFADVEEATGNISPAAIKRAINKKTRAVIVVHYAGCPCRMDEIRSLCRKHSLALIEDAAHAIGAQYRGKYVGCLGDVASFSFYATKNITTGEGGMITTNNKRLAERMRILSLHGLSADAWKRYSPSANAFYSVIDAGFKYNMFDLQAALGIEQLKKLPMFLKKRALLWKKYNECFSDIPEITLPYIDDTMVHGMHLYVIRIHTRDITVSREVVMEMLKRKGIYTQVHFQALHTHAYYGKVYGLKPHDLPVAYHLSQSYISLPFYPLLTEDDICYIGTTLKNILKKVRRKKKSK